MSEPVHTAERLAELQALPLHRKIQISQARIIEWYQRNNGNVVISFSGGKDSTVLLHMVRTLYPDVPAVFSNTGLEYGEIQRFVRTIPNVTIVAPKMRFDQVISKYGYPLIGKEVAEAIYYARRIRSQTVNVERERENKSGLIETSGAANRRTILQGKWGGQSLSISGTHYMGYGSNATNTQKADGACRSQTSRGSKWGDYHRRSLNNDPNNPRDLECFYNRDPKRTDWSDWRRGCL